MTGDNDVSNAEILRELLELRAQVNTLLHDFGPLLAVFRPQNGARRASYVEIAGMAKTARRAMKGGTDGGR